ncbi:hypothetical protein Tco_0684549 [Tanacetum coccineum]
MFLGHVVNMIGIKACPEKAEAVIKIQSPRILKEVQSLNGKLASLNRSGQRSPTNRKRLTTNADLLRQSRSASSKSKLQLDGKIGVSSSACLKKVKKILLSTSNNAHRRTAKSVIGRLLAAAASYYIWEERNKRISRMLEEQRKSFVIS